MRSPDEWWSTGSAMALPAGDIFTTTLGSETAKAPVLVLHGFPSSSWDFSEAAELIARDRRVVLFDFLGFGFSDKPADAGYGLFEQAEIAIAIAKHHGITRCHLWAHDMGTSVATELLARREHGQLPFELASVALMNGSVHIGMAHLTPGQRILRTRVGALFARISGRRIFGAQMKRIFARTPSEETLDGMWSQLSRADGTLRLPKTIRYIEERTRFERRWIGALERLDLPLLVAWGARDPVARMAIGERLARETKGAKLVRWDDLGHYPQMEDPTRVAADLAAHFAANDGSP